MITPSTRKLFWIDPYRQRFTAQVLERHEGDPPSIVLNRTLFYPTGGGQPHDSGRLGDAHVLAVEQEDGRIQHFVDRMPLDNEEICGEIDWPRRLDHMQQHSGQHLLSAAFLDLLGRPTVGFHLSADSVTIDIPGAAPSATELDQVLAFTQSVITEDRPVTSVVLPASKATRLPLRKAPTVTGPVRVVEISDIDWSACGGTHVRSTAAIGSVVITRLERRGDQTRVHFLCGERALADYRQRLAVTQALGDTLTTGLPELPAAVSRLQEELKSSQRSLHKAKAQLAETEAEQLWHSAPQIDDTRLIRHTIIGNDPKALNQLLRRLTDHPNTIAVLGHSGRSPRWATARSASLTLDLKQVLSSVLAIPGVQGGGSPQLIQGGAPDAATLEAVLSSVETRITTMLQNSD